SSPTGTGASPSAVARYASRSMATSTRRRPPRRPSAGSLEVLIDNATVLGDGTVRVHAHTIRSGIAIDVSDEGPCITGDPGLLLARPRVPTPGTASSGRHP